MPQMYSSPLGDGSPEEALLRALQKVTHTARQTERERETDRERDRARERERDYIRSSHPGLLRWRIGTPHEHCSLNRRTHTHTHTHTCMHACTPHCSRSMLHPSAVFAANCEGIRHMRLLASLSTAQEGEARPRDRTRAEHVAGKALVTVFTSTLGILTICPVMLVIHGELRGT